MNRMKMERHEAMYGPHFNEQCAKKAVAKMENEDGSKGPHWSLEETATIATQYGVNLKGEKFNKYDWFVALNMVRSDFYRAIVNITNSDHVKYFVELAKAWLNDKDIDEGKMWLYYKYVMCDSEYEDEYEDEYPRHSNAARYGRNRAYEYDRYYDDDDDDYEYNQHTRMRNPMRNRISRY